MSRHLSRRRAEGCQPPEDRRAGSVSDRRKAPVAYAPGSPVCFSMRLSMSVRAAFLAFLLSSSAVCWAAEPSSPKGEAELHTLKGTVVKGSLESITDKEIVINEKSTRVATPLAQVLKIDFPEAKSVKATDKYADVELTDGSLF